MLVSHDVHPCELCPYAAEQKKSKLAQKWKGFLAFLARMESSGMVKKGVETAFSAQSTNLQKAELYSSRRRRTGTGSPGTHGLTDPHASHTQPARTQPQSLSRLPTDGRSYHAPTQIAVAHSGW